jgi:dihydroneopterin aldolase
LFLRGHVLDVHIGIHDFEQARAAAHASSMWTCTCLTHSDPSRDQHQDIVDYDFIRRHLIRQRTSRRPYRTCRKRCATRSPPTCWATRMSQAVRVATAKLDVYPDCDAVGRRSIAVAHRCAKR